MRTLITTVALLAASSTAIVLDAADPGKPLEVLLIAGGCCHVILHKAFDGGEVLRTDEAGGVQDVH